MNNCLNGIQEIGLELVSLYLKYQNESEVSVKLGLGDEACQSTATNHNDLIPSFLYLLLKHGVSNECYHEMAMLLPELPISHKVSRLANYIAS